MVISNFWQFTLSSLANKMWICFQRYGEFSVSSVKMITARVVKILCVKMFYQRNRQLYILCICDIEIIFSFIIKTDHWRDMVFNFPKDIKRWSLFPMENDLGFIYVVNIPISFFSTFLFIRRYGSKSGQVLLFMHIWANLYYFKICTKSMIILTISLLLNVCIKIYMYIGKDLRVLLFQISIETWSVRPFRCYSPYWNMVYINM